jgi:hypothetical protein
MGRGMRWSPIGEGKYSSIPSRTARTPPSSPGGDIELSNRHDCEEEDEFDVYSVHTSSQSKVWILAILFVAAVCFATVSIADRNKQDQSEQQSNVLGAVEFPSDVLFGTALIEDAHTIKSNDFSPPYDIQSDFLNELGNIPPFWEEVEHIANTTGAFSGVTSWGPCYPIQYDWREQVSVQAPFRSNNDEITYLNAPGRHGDKTPQSSFYSGNHDVSINTNLAGLCRPGYIIIGQAKCGTSSLYQYLSGHPRVLPAKQKQLNYFKYLAYMPMEWYLSNFPSAQSFLARGALMTGESSPSYFPYPEVPHLIHERMRAENEPHPKIIAIVRDPISRSMSSYKYNYVDPALKMLSKRPKNPQAHAALENIPEEMPDEYYIENHLFTFEELVRAEIKVLQQCLVPDGVAEQMSRSKYGPPNGMYADDFTDAAIPLINADEFCYGESISDAVPLAQWAELIQQNPNKLIVGLDYHLIRSIVGRSLYSLFMDWWYARFSQDDIYLICTEDLHFEPAETMLNVSLFLGLPRFDFTNVTSEGMYNVGFHQGYDTLTTWDEIEEEAVSEDDQDDRDYANIGHDVDLSEELRNELMEFFLPYNEALFKLTGKRCQWE